MRKKQTSTNATGTGTDLKEEEGMVNFRRACLIEKWMEKKVSEKVVVRRNSVALDSDRKSRHHHRDNNNSNNVMLLNSSSSSSESSSGGGFSSSESDSFRTSGSKSRSSSSCYSMQRPKPIRTSVSAAKPTLFYDNHNHQDRLYDKSYSGSAPKQKPKQHENGFVKTKSKALKIYGDLKKVKQPISPGGRLASFINSLFTAGNTKKAKIDDLGSQRKSKSTNGSTTTCSSASSFSRSCLSNTPSSRGKFTGAGAGVKRSVRFFPVSVIVDEDCRPCGHKSLHGDHQESTAAALMALTNNVEQVGYYVVDDDRRRVQEVAIDLLKSYQKKNNINDVKIKNDSDNNNGVVEFDMRDVVHGNDDNIEVSDIDDDDDDAASYSSSDLFELDNLSAIGIERYREELPVYETTHFDTNRAIASGLIL